jgi:Cu-processing system ATP-binding protein
MIDIIQLNKKFGRLKVLDQVSVSLQKGQAVSFIGPNGSGKTTLIKSILGLVIPDSGEIKLDGESVLGSWAIAKKSVICRK